MKKKILKKVFSGLSIATLAAGMFASSMIVSGCTKEEPSPPEYDEEAEEDAPPPYRENDPAYNEKESELPPPIERILRER